MSKSSGKKNSGKKGSGKKGSGKKGKKTPPKTGIGAFAAPTKPGIGAFAVPTKPGTGAFAVPTKPGTGAFAAPPKIRLSQCMIVKNEEKNIERALSWGKGIVSEQIVVDTGSTDRTVEIAERMGAKVLHFTWIDDFSAAKNYAIEQASGDWIAFLDADEYFQPEDVKKLMEILAVAQGDLRVDVITARMVHVNGDGDVLGTAPQQRVFRNGKKVRYQHRIHESLHGVDGAHVAAYDAQDELLIIHTGYEQGDDVGKGLRNVALLKKDLEDSPNDAMRLMYLADAYIVADMEEDALETYRRILWDPQVEITDALTVARSGFQIMATRRNDPLEEIEDEYRRIYDRVYEVGWGDHPDADYHMGLWHIMAGHLAEAAELFDSALDKMETYKEAEDVRMLSNIKVPYWVTAAGALSKGNLQKAVSRAVDCLRVDKYNGDGIHVLIKAFQFEFQSKGAGNSGAIGNDDPAGRIGAAMPYRGFLFKLYDAGNLKDVLFLHKFAKEAGFAALDELICQALPPEVRGQV